MAIGILDPIDRAVIILSGAALAVLGALLGRSRYRILLCWSFGLMAASVGAILGGLGGRPGPSMQWALMVLPFPLGFIMGVVAAVLMVKESFSRKATF